MGLPQQVKGLYNTITGRGGARYYLLPVPTGVPAVGTVVTTGAGAWGAAVDLIALAAIVTEFWICGFYLNTAGALQIFEVAVWTGAGAAPAAGTRLTDFRVDLTAVTPNLGFLPVGPYPVYQAAGARVQAYAGGAAAKVLGVSTLVTIGLN